MMAPYILTIDAAYVGRSEKKLEGFDLAPPRGRVRIQEIVGSAMLSRTWYNSHTLELGGRYVSARYDMQDEKEFFASQRFAGPTLGFAHASAEHTPYTGRRVAFSLSGVATYFPEAFGDADFTMTDLRGTTGVVMPLPISRRLPSISTRGYAPSREPLAGKTSCSSSSGAPCLAVSDHTAVSRSASPILR